MPIVTKSLHYFMRPEGPKGYTTREQIENYLLITIDPSFYDQVDQWIMEIEEYIDHKTGRNFVASGPEERVFDGANSNKLIIDDCVEILKIESGRTDRSEILSENYVTYPLNARKLSRPVPITSLRMLGGWFYGCYPQLITVLGKWGYSIHPPLDIRMAATVLVSGIINYAWNSDGEVKSMTIGRYSVTYKDEKQWQDFEKVDGNKGILEMYRKFTF